MDRIQLVLAGLFALVAIVVIVSSIRRRLGLAHPLFFLILGWAMPWTWSRHRVVRRAGNDSKAVILIYGFSFLYLVYSTIVAAAILAGVTVSLWNSGDTLLYTDVALSLVIVFLGAGFFEVLAINYAVEKDGENLTGRKYLPGRHWRVPFAFDVDWIDYRTRRSVYLFIATLKNGGRVLCKIYAKWHPNPEMADSDGEDTFFHQGQDAVDGALLQQGAELSDTFAQLDDVKFQQRRQALSLAHQCSVQVASDRQPHRDLDFLARNDVLKPKDWDGRPIESPRKKLWFYAVNRAAVLGALDPVPGGEHAGEHGIGETHSHFEELHGVHADDNGMEADFDVSTGKLLHGRLATDIIREVCGADVDIKPTDVLAAMERAVVVSSTGGGTVIPLLGGVQTTFEKGGH